MVKTMEMTVTEWQPAPAVDFGRSWHGGEMMLSVFLTKELESHAVRAYNAELAFFLCSAENGKHNTTVAVLQSTRTGAQDHRQASAAIGSQAHTAVLSDARKDTRHTLLCLETGSTKAMRVRSPRSEALAL